MKELKRFITKYKDKILSGVTLLLLAATIGLALLYMISESINPGMIFFVGAALMIDLAVNYNMQKKKSKGVFVFYAFATIACIAIGCFLRLMPVE